VKDSEDGKVEKKDKNQKEESSTLWDGVVIIALWGGLVLSLHTNILPRIVEVILISGALVYMFLLGIMFLTMGVSLMEYLKSKLL